MELVAYYRCPTEYAKYLFFTFYNIEIQSYCFVLITYIKAEKEVQIERKINKQEDSSSYRKFHTKFQNRKF